ncbi:unnamed protein product [Acanthoscelides obtectus]|uniref:Uncharacterized protein n=1 Tax=Acanthoscelides obtectus TaxID=200917 RepID=A0A9P0NVY7_ACAOB|nr:unnamed protein product [Acanthoscelides obtectus]CAK1678955.1 hypothetical protein AOBTE_LOCUS32073 [Acanthoscelides obtectus]
MPLLGISNRVASSACYTVPSSTYTLYIPDPATCTCSGTTERSHSSREIMCFCSEDQMRFCRDLLQFTNSTC